MCNRLRHIHANVSLEPQPIEQAEIHVVGLSTRFFGVDSEKNNVASKLPRLWAAFLPRLGEVPNRIGSGCYGVVRQSAERSDELEYWAAAEGLGEPAHPRGSIRPLRAPRKHGGHGPDRQLHLLQLVAAVRKKTHIRV